VIGLLRNSDFCRQEESRFIETGPCICANKCRGKTAELQESRTSCNEAQKRQEAEGLLRKNAEIID
jgi:hypothetical protein